ncbi:MAG: HEPN domain-containing protein [Planctomycetes bacterium]|nr:HEPN domain-containing protein [Planctomycetota bacterium]
MDEATRELVRGWLTKARHDLDTAGQIAALPDGHLDIAIYHCQQAAEKAVKAYLAFRDHVIERTHDVERLVSAATAYEPAYAAWVAAGALLTPYGTAYRYPGEAATPEPARTEFDEALREAQALFQFTLSLIPGEAHP